MICIKYVKKESKPKHGKIVNRYSQAFNPGLKGCFYKEIIRGLGTIVYRKISDVMVIR